MPSNKPTQNRRRPIGERLSDADSVFGGAGLDYRFCYLTVDQVRPNPANARRHYDQTRLEELAASISKHGVIQPITVKPAGNDGLFEIIAGERRYRASQLAGKTRIPAVVRQTTNSGTVSLIENLQREDLNAMEEALGMQHLMEAESITQVEVAGEIGRSKAYVSQTLGLLSLREEVKQAVLDGAAATKSQLQELTGLPEDEQLRLWQLILRGATVRDLREAKKARSDRSRTPSAYFDQVERRLMQVSKAAGTKSSEERERLREGLVRLRETIDQALSSLSS